MEFRHNLIAYDVEIHITIDVSPKIERTNDVVITSQSNPNVYRLSSIWSIICELTGWLSALSMASRIPCVNFTFERK